MKQLIVSKTKKSFLGGPKATPKPTSKPTVFHCKKPQGFLTKKTAAKPTVKPTVKPVTMAKPTVINVRLARQRATMIELQKKHGLLA